LPRRKPRKKKEEKPTEKKEIAISEKKSPTTERKAVKPATLMPYSPRQVWRNFDRLFEGFRSDFEDLLWPIERPVMRALSRLPAIETRVPYVDLEDRGKDYRLAAEMPGFKKDDVELHVTENSIEISATTGWKYDEKTKRYLCKERACESFYRMLELPEKIKADATEASLKDGVLEIILPKQAPKQKKKVQIK
jgi:HSP20 family protein